MPDPTTSPAADPIEGAPSPAAGQDSSSKGRDRYAQLVSVANDAKRSRDSAIEALAKLREESSAKNQEIDALKAAVESLKQTFESGRPQPRAAWTDIGTMSDDQLSMVLTSPGPVDPLTGTATPPNPHLVARAQYELNERNARRIAEKMASEQVGKLTQTIDARDRARDEMAKAERRLMAVYGAPLQDPNSPLRQTAMQLLPQFSSEYGDAYAKSPVGLQHLFAESQRILSAEDAKAAKAEASKLRSAQAQRDTRQWGSGGPPLPTPQTALEALKSKPGREGVREALKQLKTYGGYTEPQE